MKAITYNSEGNKAKEIELPSFFSSEIREDIILKCLEAMKTRQPYAPYFKAGEYSASGKIRHMRHKWRTAYGKGISRVPRKIMWRRGDHFFWIGADIASARGGRRAHPPRIERRLKKINKKEMIIALKSALAATSIIDYSKKRYSRFKDVKIEKISFPIVVDTSVVNLKTKDFFRLMKKILNVFYDVAIKEKETRAGKGKARGRRYKSNAGMLLIVGNKEKKRINGIDAINVNELTLPSLADGGIGRIVVYSENAIKELNDRLKER